MKSWAGLAIFTAAILGLQGLSACQNSSSSRAQDPLAKQYQHIDRGEYSEAINELTDLAARDPRPEVLVTLASAYAARAGVKVAQYWGFVVGFKTPLLKANDFGEPTPAPGTAIASGSIAAFADTPEAQGLANLVTLWGRYQVRIDAIPVVRGSAHDDLTSAVEVLSRVQTPGGRLYRAILDLILFKSAIVAEEKPLKEAGAMLTKVARGESAPLCSFNFTAFANQTRQISYHLGETLNDLSIAFPEQSATLTPAKAQVAEFDQALQKAKKQLRQSKGCR
jgi:hypothetical protein